MQLRSLVATSPLRQAGSRGQTGAGSGVFDDGEATSLPRQVEQLASLVNSGIVEARDLEQSVALVAVSTGHDYNGLITHETSSNQVSSLLALLLHIHIFFIYM